MTIKTRAPGKSFLTQGRWALSPDSSVAFLSPSASRLPHRLRFPFCSSEVPDADNFLCLMSSRRCRVCDEEAADRDTHGVAETLPQGSVSVTADGHVSSPRWEGPGAQARPFWIQAAFGIPGLITHPFQPTWVGAQGSRWTLLIQRGDSLSARQTLLLHGDVERSGRSPGTQEPTLQTRLDPRQR